MKILSIGNSFSQDAHKWLREIASNHGMELETANLYIGGCSLQTHWENLVNDNAHYELEWNGGAAERRLSACLWRGGCERKDQACYELQKTCILDHHSSNCGISHCRSATPYKSNCKEHHVDGCLLQAC